MTQQIKFVLHKGSNQPPVSSLKKGTIIKIAGDCSGFDHLMVLSHNAIMKMYFGNHGFDWEVLTAAKCPDRIRHRHRLQLRRPRRKPPPNNPKPQGASPMFWPKLIFGILIALVGIFLFIWGLIHLHALLWPLIPVTYHFPIYLLAIGYITNKLGIIIAQTAKDE